MLFSDILSGKYVVWHNRVAQIDVELIPDLEKLNKIEMTIALNQYNPDTDIRVYYKTTPTGALHFLGQLQLTAPVVLPVNATFNDGLYALTFAPIYASNLRFVISKDGVNPKEFTPVKKYSLYNDNHLVIGGSNFIINQLGWQTGEVFRTIFRYLDSPLGADEDEYITGHWDFEIGELTIERGAHVPLNPKTGRLFFCTTNNCLYIGNGLSWTRFIKEHELTPTGVYCETAEFSYATPSVYIFTIPKGATIKRTQVDIKTIFNDSNTIITVGTNATPDLLTQSSDLHPQMLGKYELKHETKFASSTDIKIFVTNIGTAGTGEVTVEYSTEDTLGIPEIP